MKDFMLVPPMVAFHMTNYAETAEVVVAARTLDLSNHSLVLFLVNNNQQFDKSGG